MTAAGPDRNALARWSSAAAEPAWLLAARLAALEGAASAPVPAFAADIAALVADDAATEAAIDAVPFEEGGAAAPDEQEEPELPDHYRQRGVIVGPLRDMAVAHPELVGRHLGSVVGPWLDRMAALNAAWWSGGTLVHVPAGVEVEVPIQATSDRRAATAGRFERTLVVAEEGSAVHLLQGCSAPVYSADPLRCTVVEVVVGAGASVTHTSVQNWSTNVTNLAIKRAVVGAAGRMEWIDGNMGAGRTVTQPGIVLAGPEATGFVRSAAAAGPGQRQQVGARIVHRAPQTTAAVEARLIAANGGWCHHQGQVTVGPSAAAASCTVHSAAMLVDQSASVGAEVDRRLDRSDAVIEETAAAAGLDDSARVYLASRGLTGDQADALLLNGFLAPISRHLPLEYAVEWHRLVENRVGASVG